MEPNPEHGQLSPDPPTPAGQSNTNPPLSSPSPGQPTADERPSDEQQPEFADSGVTTSSAVSTPLAQEDEDTELQTYAFCLRSVRPDGLGRVGPIRFTP